jgi:hypothetical protein
MLKVKCQLSIRRVRTLAALHGFSLGSVGTFPASAMDTVLLTPAEINTLVAGAGDPLLQMKESTFGMLNNAKLVDPPSCVGVVFTGDHAVLADTGLHLHA